MSSVPHTARIAEIDVLGGEYGSVPSHANPERDGHQLGFARWPEVPPTVSVCVWFSVFKRFAQKKNQKKKKGGRKPPLLCLWVSPFQRPGSAAWTGPEYVPDSLLQVHLEDWLPTQKKRLHAASMGSLSPMAQYCTWLFSGSSSVAHSLVHVRREVQVSSMCPNAVHEPYLRGPLGRKGACTSASPLSHSAVCDAH